MRCWQQLYTKSKQRDNQLDTELWWLNNGTDALLHTFVFRADSNYGIGSIPFHAIISAFSITESVNSAYDMNWMCAATYYIYMLWISSSEALELLKMIIMKYIFYPFEIDAAHGTVPNHPFIYFILFFCLLLNNIFLDRKI